MYREKAKIPPEPKKLRIEVCNALLKTTAFFCVLCGFFGGFYYLEHKADKEAPFYLEKRHSAAERWMDHNMMIGVATCYLRNEKCDIVPKGDRAPFSISCNESACWLPDQNK